MVLTVILALIFTGLQGLEYAVSSFTFSDSTYGSCFYFGTGFHGLTHVAPSYLVFLIYLLTCTTYQASLQLAILLPFITVTANNKTVKLDRDFIEWLVGFTDSEGNFNISLNKLKESDYDSQMLTFQIGLHKDDTEVLRFLEKKAKLRACQ